MDAGVRIGRAAGSHSLRRFLLDLDAKDASGDNTSQTIGEVIQLYFAFDAPETADGLSASTFRTYRHSANRHLLGMPGMDKGRARPPANYAVRFAAQPATTFNEPDAPRALREAMRARHGGTVRPRTRLARPIGGALMGRELRARAGDQNQRCLFANEKISNRRKSMRGAHGRATVRRHGDEVRSWALSPIGRRAGPG